MFKTHGSNTETSKQIVFRLKQGLDNLYDSLYRNLEVVSIQLVSLVIREVMHLVAVRNHRLDQVSIQLVSLVIREHN
ncbi:MAG: hypothetical protein ACFCU7_06370 [Pleurocapsa sp.]